MPLKIHYLCIIILISNNYTYAQSSWKSVKYNYEIEIPLGFSKINSTGINTDFKATNGLSTIAIVVKTIPKEYVSYTIWEMLGDLNTFGEEWELGAKEYMNNPTFLKYGKTSLSGLETFWYDYTTDNHELYYKTYQTQKGNKLYTITLTCLNAEYNNYSSIWYRFKDRLKIY